MAIILKSAHEIEQMRKAGQIVAEAFEHLRQYVGVDVATEDLDRRAEEFIRRRGARPMYKGYRPPGHKSFPATICVAVNDQIVHGIPRRELVLHDGDVVGIDIGVMYNGWIGDACRTYAVGDVDSSSRLLVETTERCLERGIAQAHVGKRLGDIGAAIQSHAEENGFSVVRDLFGHGVGRALWEEPTVRHFGRAGTGLALQKGMVFTIEPMINAGRPEIHLERDGWTISTADGSRSAQFEDTVALTPHGPEVLTRV